MRVSGIGIPETLSQVSGIPIPDTSTEMKHTLWQIVDLLVNRSGAIYQIALRNTAQELVPNYTKTMTVQIKISLDEQLLQQVDTAAQETKISRNQLFILAVEEFLKLSENERLLIAINHVYENNPPTEEDQAYLEAMRRHYSKMLKQEDW